MPSGVVRGHFILEDGGCGVGEFGEMAIGSG